MKWVPGRDFFIDKDAEVSDGPEGRVVVERGVVIEQGVVIEAPAFIGYNTIIRPRVRMDAFSEIRANCYIAEEATIGSHVKIFQFSNISKGAVIEDHVYIGARVLFTNTYKISHGRSYEPRIEGPRVCYGARIASGAIILPGIRIGKNALVGAGSVVTRDVQDETVVMGVPARATRIITDEERLL